MKKCRVICFLFIKLFIINYSLFAQGKNDTLSQLESYIQLSYNYFSNDTVLLTADLHIRKEEGVFYLSNAPIQFLAVSEKKNIDFGTIASDSTGKATLLIPLSKVFPDYYGETLTYKVVFTGRGCYLPCMQEIAVKPAFIQIEFIVIDSLRYIQVFAAYKDKKGDTIPLSGETVNVYTPRLFNNLNIGEIIIEENGIGRIEFPHDFVGDTVGNILIITKIEDHDLFGNVSSQASVNWAIPKHYIDPEKPRRELWTPIAPIWMIVTLIIMLTGVWAHYIYTIIQLLKIRQSSKNTKPLAL